MLPNPMRGKSGDLYVSHADFLCPSNCNEPDDYCTSPENPENRTCSESLVRWRFRDFDLLSSKVINWAPVSAGIVRQPFSQLLDQIKPHALADPTNNKSLDVSLDDSSFEIKMDDRHYLISTACRCHGVITGFEWMGKESGMTGG